LNERIESWIVESNAARTRLDQFLANQLPDESRSQIQIWIRKGYVTVNGECVKTGYRVREKDAVAIKVPSLPPDQPFPEEISLDILYEDPDLAVLNKPAGMVCHIGAGVRSGTLVNALLHRMGSLSTGDPARPGIVHRLDKFTSGVMLIAKNPLSHRLLSQQFKSRQIRKEYIALVHGVPSPSVGTIDQPIGRDPQNRIKMSTRARHKRSAITHYSVKESFGFVSLLDVRIETGRTHQIRVHLAHKGHPIVGDTLYGGNRSLSLSRPSIHAVKIQRPFLHSSKLSFRHPRSDEFLSFQAPLPQELQDFLEAI
jgi:23S rRNA pseudouridine1911/1915/1917 synthase